MSAICIGGCCIPYSAILPFLAIILQFFAKPLAEMGLLPAPIAKKLGVLATGTTACSEESCCGTEKKERRSKRSVAATETTLSMDEIMYEVTDAAYFQSLLKSNDVVFVKFTAEWCQPCKKIQPFYHELAEKYVQSSDKNIAFATVDVDELDEIASNYKVAMMPTFVAIRNGTGVHASMSGSNEGKLETFVKSAVE
jgi:thioredoxin 1